MTENGNRQHPEWQKAIREAQANQEKIDTEKDQKRTEEHARQKAETEGKTLRVMKWLGIEPDTIVDQSAFIGPYEITLYDSHYDTDPGIRVGAAEATPYDDDMGVNPPYAVFGCRWYAHERDNDDATYYRAALADAFDEIDRRLPEYERAVVEARARLTAQRSTPAASKPQKSRLDRVVDALEVIATAIESYVVMRT